MKAARLGIIAALMTILVGLVSLAGYGIVHWDYFSDQREEVRNDIDEEEGQGAGGHSSARLEPNDDIDPVPLEPALARRLQHGLPTQMIGYNHLLRIRSTLNITKNTVVAPGIIKFDFDQVSYNLSYPGPHLQPSEKGKGVLYIEKRRVELSTMNQELKVYVDLANRLVLQAEDDYGNIYWTIREEPQCEHLSC